MCLQTGGDGNVLVCKRGDREFACLVVFTLCSMIVVCLAEKSTSSSHLKDAYTLLHIAVRIARTCGLNAEWKFTSGPGLTPLLELVRRVWWMLFALDRHISVLGDRDPLLEFGQCEVRFPCSDGEYADALGDLEISAGVFEDLNAGPVLVTKPLASHSHSQYAFFRPFRMGEERIPPPFHPFEYYVFLMDLWDRILRYRRGAMMLGLAPYAPTSTRLAMLADLKAWFAGLPPFIQAFDADPALPFPDKKGIGHRLIMFHAAYALLCAPADVGKGDAEWVASEAFVSAQEHSLRTTEWLKAMLAKGTMTAHFATGVGCWLCLGSWARLTTFLASSRSSASSRRA
jgi:hypothetical protein